jgi:myosin heavy subunit
MHAIGLEEGEEVEQIAEILKKRLLTKQDMYTSVGHNVLVAMNPYEVFILYMYMYI